MVEYKYGNIEGYKPQRFEDIDLANCRSGLSAANPAMVLLLVKKIDELQAHIDMQDKLIQKYEVA